MSFETYLVAQIMDHRCKYIILDCVSQRSSCSYVIKYVNLIQIRECFEQTNTNINSCVGDSTHKCQENVWEVPKSLNQMMHWIDAVSMHIIIGLSSFLLPYMGFLKKFSSLPPLRKFFVCYEETFPGTRYILRVGIDLSYWTI